MLVCTEIWIVIYNIFIPIIKNTTFSWKELFLNMLFLKKVALGNMLWYIPMIIGIYIAIPFLAMLVKKIDIKTMKIPMIIIFIASFLIPNVSKITKLLLNEEYSLILDISFLGGVYGLYLVLGYYIGEEGILKKIKVRYLILISSISFVITCVYQMYLYYNNIAYNVWYNFSGLLIIAICLFELISRIKINLNEKIAKILAFISKSSLASYFLQIIVLRVIMRIHKISIINKPISILILTILVTIITILIIAILSKIKLIRNKVLLIK